MKFKSIVVSYFFLKEITVPDLGSTEHMIIYLMNTHSLDPLDKIKFSKAPLLYKWAQTIASQELIRPNKVLNC